MLPILSAAQNRKGPESYYYYYYYYCIIIPLVSSKLSQSQSWLVYFLNRQLFKVPVQGQLCLS